MHLRKKLWNSLQSLSFTSDSNSLFFDAVLLTVLFFPRYCWPYAEGNHRPGPIHHQDQDHRSPRKEVLRMDRWFHLGLPVHLPTDVDLQAGIRRIRPWNRPPQMLLSTLHTIHLENLIHIICIVLLLHLFILYRCDRGCTAYRLNCIHSLGCIR